MKKHSSVELEAETNSLVTTLRLRESAEHGFAGNPGLFGEQPPYGSADQGSLVRDDSLFMLGRRHEFSSMHASAATSASFSLRVQGVLRD
ncbi:MULTISPECIES: hypothetical protein [unclassified Mesorhizobium]|uniref:hypothetical protein n=1 Tax=unclassified Mesorhizobium TaxID=325217 RepID=UPI0015E373E1|nr:MULTISPECIES: hypothetical protein [unclassified Mesorhizobium]MBZ9811679.1 hypothetical protein [Mesorhizobium sp. ESP-6-2]